MGCFPDKKQEQFKPTKETEKKMKKIFKHLKDMNEETEHESYLTLEALQFYFIENPQFAKQLINFMSSISFNGKVYKKHYFQAIETLMAERSQRPLEQFSHFSKFQVLSLIALGQTTPSKELKANLKINYEQATMIIEIVLRMFLVDAENYNPNLVESLKTLAMSVVDSYFERSGMKINSILWKEFVNSIQNKFQFIDYLLDAYYNAKFMNKTLKINLPKLNLSEVELLDPDTLKLFIMINKVFSQVSELKLIYSHQENEFDFKELTKKLEKFNGPTLLLFEHLPEPPTSNFMKQTDTKSEIFGVFTAKEWEKSKKMQGDYNTFLFRQSPKFFIYQIQPENYQYNPKPCYLYNKDKKEQDYPHGLGFGGEFNNKKEFKLWIDESLQESYYTENDQMFEQGNLVSANEPLNVQKVEAWGLVVTPGRQIFELAERTEGFEKIKINSQRSGVEKGPPIMVSSEIIYPPSVQAQPIKNEIYEEQNYNEEENLFRPKSSIFKKNISSTTPKDLNTKKMINSLLEEHSYRLSKSQIVSVEPTVVASTNILKN